MYHDKVCKLILKSQETFSQDAGLKVRALAKRRLVSTALLWRNVRKARVLMRASWRAKF